MRPLCELGVTVADEPSAWARRNVHQEVSAFRGAGMRRLSEAHLEEALVEPVFAS